MYPIDMVYLDVGKVIVNKPSLHNRQRLMETAGIDRELFLERYQRMRREYDRGDVTPGTYWSYIVHGDNTPLSGEMLTRLIEIDNECWSEYDSEILHWNRLLKKSGLKTGLFSNMPSTFAEHVRTNMTWFNDFEVHILSCEWRQVKPECDIYRTAVMQCGVESDRILFVDDLEENIEAARDAGMHGIVYRGMAELMKTVEKEFHLPVVAGQMK